MKLKVLRANPAGNITLFVLTPVEKELHAVLAERLMAMEEFKAEQVGYWCPAADGTDGHMRMSGGEFCGNATRAYGMLMAAQKGMTGRGRLTLEVSGCDRPVGVDVDMDAHTARSEMPLPRFVRREAVDDREGVLVHLGGIAHFVIDGVEPTMAYFEKAEKALFTTMQEPDAYGVIFLDSAGGRMTPLVKVPAANSLFWEGSCGSGSLAAILALSEGRGDGEYTSVFTQPAGTVRATAVRRDGKIVETYIGGSVELDEPVEIEL